ncbi:hypothetical protein SODALDRAFT_353942 [Sodiomyces alkalinus F11]|uniref:Uncharacterized protein n=1 Tax=Sodiomyces alkalinus (strain CBS 110278 / VKM F-3762 / F11) TaxID=1314773 RepID=A0A3N2Q5C1_SODAK|nr:hypothetical protein SODALDRAFT_353942 [Sodiomyces alkalinus F11]ROT41825.1 hypothetical protein SODALDRAFT_353942 [Sodiomyces alkalinus F11]
MQQLCIRGSNTSRKFHSLVTQEYACFQVVSPAGCQFQQRLVYEDTKVHAAKDRPRVSTAFSPTVLAACCRSRLNPSKSRQSLKHHSMHDGQVTVRFVVRLMGSLLRRKRPKLLRKKGVGGRPKFAPRELSFPSLQMGCFECLGINNALCPAEVGELHAPSAFRPLGFVLCLA